jgi:carbonic anhydrase
MMRILFDFHSNRQPYTADAVVICCFDARTRLIVGEFLRRYDIANPDMVVIAGGGLALSSPRTEFDRPFVLEQVQLAARLHRARRVILMSHSDCATYGGLAKFDGDHARELAHHGAELCRAAEVIKNTFPDLTVERVFLRFDSVMSVADEECTEH